MAPVQSSTSGISDVSMASSGVSASFRNLSCWALVGFIFVDPSFSPRCLSCADDANQIVVLGVSVNDQDQHDPVRSAQCVPSLFARFEPVETDKVQWVIPYQSRVLKRDPVLVQIYFGLRGVPFEA